MRGRSTGRPSSRSTRRSPPSFVLNGAIFALWGYRDVGVGLDDRVALEQFEALTSALAANLERWDTGFWSRYDLYPHRVRTSPAPPTTCSTSASSRCSTRSPAGRSSRA